MRIWRVGLVCGALIVGVVVLRRGDDAPSAPPTVAARTVAGAAPGVPGSGASSGSAAVTETLRLEGLVLDDEDRPVGGVTIHVVDSRRSAISGPDGSFAITNLPTSAYTLYATHDVYFADDTQVNLTATSDPVLLHVARGAAIVVAVTDADSGAPIEGAVVSDGRRSAVSDDEGRARLRGVPPATGSLDVSAADHGPARLLLLGGPELAVALPRGAPVSGVVVDPDGARVAYPDVELQGHGWSGTVHGTATGAWSIAGLARGTYVLSASSDAFDEGDTVLVKLDGMHPRSDVVVRVAPGLQIVGAVVDRAGAPVGGARVIVNSGQYDPITTMSDAAGRFRLQGLPRTSLQIWAAAGTRASPRTDVDGAPGEPREVRLVVEPSTIAGTVVDGAGEPVVGARVVALGGHTSVEDRSDGGGRFELGAPSGDYSISASSVILRAGSRPSSMNVRTHTGDHGVTLVLPSP